MGELKKRLLIFNLVIINMLLVALLVNTGIIIINDIKDSKPITYQKVVSGPNDSIYEHFHFCQEYNVYRRLVLNYNHFPEPYKELGSDGTYATEVSLKFSEDFFEEKNLLVIHVAGKGYNAYKDIISYKEIGDTAYVTIEPGESESTEDNIEHIYMIPVTKGINRASIKYTCEDSNNDLIKIAIPIAIVIFFDVLLIGYFITQKKIFLTILIRVVLAVIIIAIFAFILIYLYNSSHPSISEKPILYLYPEEEMQVSIKLGYEDKISCSYPTYNNGWDVIAKPTGDLIDLNSGRNLYSLYYECDNAIDFTIEKDGFVVKSDELVGFLEEKLNVLGLTEREAEEFIVYWLPRLQANKYNYIRFATMDEINQNMPLDFSTNPDTLIRVLMTYKAIDHPIEVEEQKLTTPERKGFTAVEWGGVQIKD